MKRWRLETFLLLAILSTCLVTISADDENIDDDDGVTIESEKVVSFLNFIGRKIDHSFENVRDLNRLLVCSCSGISKAST